MPSHRLGGEHLLETITYIRPLSVNYGAASWVVLPPLLLDPDRSGSESGTPPSRAHTCAGFMGSSWVSRPVWFWLKHAGTDPERIPKYLS